MFVLLVWFYIIQGITHGVFYVTYIGLAVLSAFALSRDMTQVG